MTTRDHGGNLDEAMARFGGTRADWLDLSTGINPVPYPLPDLPASAWAALPTRAETTALETAAKRAYRCRAEIAALAGAQAAIQLVPRLTRQGSARVLGPTYNEHAAALASQGWQPKTVSSLSALQGASLAIVVNPNNPDGQQHSAAALSALAATCGRLVVDESFADPDPEHSLAPHLDKLPNTLVLRSFGKFYGLAGLRLGFALGQPDLITSLRNLAGPWAASGPAITIGQTALADTGWHQTTTKRLTQDAARLDALASQKGWSLVGGTALFRTYATGDAAAAQTDLAQRHIWSRIFPYAPRWLRLGLPAPDQWHRLETALT